MSKHERLNSAWSVTYKGKTGKTNKTRVSATVPGNVLGDLVRDGVFPDPYVESNSLAYRELEYGDFVYETEFVTPDFLSGERVILLFGGVDSIAEYYMDGERIRADLKCTFF